MSNSFNLFRHTKDEQRLRKYTFVYAEDKLYVLESL